MQILIVTDSFKENLTAQAVTKAIAAGISGIDATIKLQCIPFSDGGEGAFNVLEKYARGKLVACETVDALGRPINANYFVFEKSDVSSSMTRTSVFPSLTCFRERDQ